MFAQNMTPGLWAQVWHVVSQVKRVVAPGHRCALASWEPPPANCAELTSLLWGTYSLVEAYGPCHVAGGEPIVDVSTCDCCAHVRPLLGPGRAGSGCAGTCNYRVCSLCALNLAATGQDHCPVCKPGAFFNGGYTDASGDWVSLEVCQTFCFYCGQDDSHAEMNAGAEELYMCQGREPDGSSCSVAYHPSCDPGYRASWGRARREGHLGYCFRHRHFYNEWARRSRFEMNKLRRAGLL